MTDFTFSEFKSVVDACFEGAGGHELVEARVDAEFTELGFDSLSVYEIVTRIQDDFGVSVPDERLDDLTTPALMIGYVRDRLAAV
ncbi:Acyl carrier protein [Streptomyces sp. enrichment culture]|jgi:minimal PKS acyl carrier protein|uniref:acyl carrier protein n=1 Tax=Streptomyces xiamenensis TaxID=408015 RepID=UPI0036E83F02